MTFAAATPLTDAEAAAFVLDRYGERAGPVSLLGAGDWSRAYAFRLDGADVVLRLGNYPEDFAKDLRMAAYSSAVLPIPRVLETGVAPRGHFAVSERAAGTFLDALDAAGMREALPVLLAAMDAMSAIDVSGTSGYGVWSPSGDGPHASWPESLLAIRNDSSGGRVPWLSRLEASSTGIGAFDAGFAALAALSAELPSDRHVIHSDLLYRNVLVAGVRIAAVYDWANSKYGDQLYDAAWLIYWWPWFPAWAEIDIRAELDRHWAATGLGRDSLDARLLCYQIHIGLEHIAYAAATGRSADLAANTRQVHSLIAGLGHGPGPSYGAGVTDAPDPAPSAHPPTAELRATVERGGAARYHAANAAKGKLPARERIALLVDAGSLAEDGMLANVLAGDLPADGVVTGVATVDGRPVALMANDSTVKAGSWGARTVEKIIRIIERAYATGVPMIYLVDSAGARITDQVELFPGRRGAGKIFYTQVRASGSIPQVCGLFGPSAAGGAYIPAFCDVVAMVDGNASMYLGSDRMVEMVTGEKTTLEAMGGAKMHCTESGVGHFLCADEGEAIAVVRRYLSYLPSNWRGTPPAAEPGEPEHIDLRALVPTSDRQAFDLRRFVRGLLDADSYFEIQARWARELTVGFGRLGGQVVGVVGNNPMFRGGVLFVDSADKAARFVQLCDAFSVPLLFLADVPGFMVGTAVEKQGIIRHGAKMISAIAEATVPKICVVIRKAYGAGLYAMAGPGFEPDATIALPTAKIAVMGAEAAVNAVYANKIAAMPEQERAAFVAQRRTEYDEDIDIVRLASELVVDAIVEPEDLRGELLRRYAAASGKDRAFSRRRHGITPV